MILETEKRGTVIDNVGAPRLFPSFSIQRVSIAITFKERTSKLFFFFVLAPRVTKLVARDSGIWSTRTLTSRDRPWATDFDTILIPAEALMSSGTDDEEPA